MLLQPPGSMAKETGPVTGNNSKCKPFCAPSTAGDIPSTEMAYCLLGALGFGSAEFNYNSVYVIKHDCWYIL